MSTIPARCVLALERRTLPGEVGAQIQAELDAVIGSCQAADEALDASARVTLVREPFEIRPEDSFVVQARDAVGRALGTPPDLVGLSFWADSAYTAAAGIPTVLFGPPGAGAHADEEWVSLEGTIACAGALLEIAREFAS